MRLPSIYHLLRWIGAVAAGGTLLLGCAARSPDSAAIEGARHRAGQAFRTTEGAPGAQGSAGSAGRQYPEASAPPVATEVTHGTLPPAWLRDASGYFPPQRYLTAVGQGADRSKAEDRARAEIARFFHSEIESDRRTHQEIRERSGPDRFQIDQRIRSEEQLQVSTRKILAGVWIARVHAVDSPDGGFYALAVLDRHQAAAALAEKIRRLDSEIRTALAGLDNQPDRLDQVRTLRACLVRHDRRAAYAAELLVLRPDSGAVGLRISRDSLANRLARILREDLRVAVAVAGAGSQQTDRALREALTEKGFSVTEQASEARLLARGSVAIESEPETGSTWKYVRWRARFELMDTAEQRIFASVADSGREGHLSYARARRRALREIETRLTADIAGRLDAFIRGDGP